MATEVRTETFISQSSSSGISRRLEDFEAMACRIEASIERQPLVWTATFSASYLVMMLTLSYARLLWYDEIITLYVCRFKSLTDLWAMLKTGAELNPPLFHLITRASETLFGENAFALRLPSMVEYWVTCLALFIFVRRRASSLFALLAALFPFATFAYDYAAEARPYAVILACCALLLLFWREAVESTGRRRKLALAAMALTVAFAVSNHYYAIFIVLPIATGELVRLVQRRKPDWPVWIAVGGGGAWLLAFLPLIHANLQIHKSPYVWNKPELTFLLDSYQTLLRLAFVPLCIPLIWLISRVRAKHTWAPEPILPKYEFAACASLILLPIVAYAAAQTITGMITERYIVETVVGFSILSASGAARISGGRRTLGLVLVLATVVVFLVQAVTNLAHQFPYRDRYEHLQAAQLARTYNLPVVQKDNLELLPLTYYAPQDFTSRLVYLEDVDLARQFQITDTEHKNMWGGRNIFPIHIEPLQKFINENDKFLIYGGPEDWLETYLLSRGARIQIVFQSDREIVLLVTQLPGTKRATSAP